QKRERLLLGLRLRDRARAHALRQPRRAVLARVPLVHRGERHVVLVDGEHGTFGEDRELLVGHDGRDFDDAVRLRVEPRHLEIDPDQVLAAIHPSAPFSGRPPKTCRCAWKTTWPPSLFTFIATR